MNKCSIKKGGMTMKEIVEKGIHAILPVYIEDKGNCTAIYTKEDTITQEKAIRSVMINLCKHYHLDLAASNKTYGELLSIKKQPPIPLSHNQVFIPVKVRQPVIKHDGAYGYINIDSIEKIVQSNSSPRKATIYLENTSPIQAMTKASTIQKNLNNGKLAKKLFNRYDTTAIREEGTFYQAQDSPATKNDIAILYRELIELKRMC